MSVEFEQPEPQQGISAEEFLELQRSSIRKKSWWAIGIGGVVVLVHLVGFMFLRSMQEEFRGEFGEELSWGLLFRSIFFVLGLLAVAGGVWGLYYSRTLSLKDLIPSEEAILFLRESEGVRLVYTFILIGGIVAVTLFQLVYGLEASILTAGLVKPEVIRNGEYWRILTGGVLHGGLLHIYFNSQALYGIGSMIEHLSNRAHIAIVMLLAIIGGGLMSVIFMPEATSVGASGGIMGLIGYLAIFGYRRKQQLPPDFLRTVLINIGFIAAFGIIAYQIIDNFAHLGGLLTGALYGVIQVPGDPHRNPRQTSAVVKALGVLSLAVILAACAYAILLISNIQA